MKDITLTIQDQQRIVNSLSNINKLIDEPDCLGSINNRIMVELNIIQAAFDYHNSSYCTKCAVVYDLAMMYCSHCGELLTKHGEQL